MKETIDVFKKIKDKLVKDKKTSNLITFLILLVIILIVSNYIFKEDEVKITSSENITYTSEEESIEKKLENILNEIAGVEDANVLLSYNSTDTIIPVYDIKEDKNIESSSGKQVEKIVTEKNVAYEEKDGVEVAIVEKKESAKASGAIVVANISSQSIEIKIKEAVSAVTEIPTHKIQVFSK